MRSHWSRAEPSTQDERCPCRKRKDTGQSGVGWGSSVWQRRQRPGGHSCKPGPAKMRNPTGSWEKVKDSLPGRTLSSCLRSSEVPCTTASVDFQLQSFKCMHFCFQLLGLQHSVTVVLGNRNRNLEWRLWTSKNMAKASLAWAEAVDLWKHMAFWCLTGDEGGTLLSHSHG